MLAAISRQPRTQKSQSVSIAAPIGGWNARDPLGAMAPLDAVTLQNMWPGTSSVIVRYGYSVFATVAGQSETLFSYSSGSANKLFTVNAGKIYDITAGGTVTSASVSSLTNSRFQYVNMTTTGGSYIMAVNGADKLRTFDGAAWHIDGDGAPYDITGFDSATSPNIVLFKNRIWLLQNNTLKAWYLPINSIGGAATALDMSSIARDGGYLMAAATWTLDAGYGMDDYLAFITSNGEALVWRLTDPTTPSGISLIGSYSLGAPVGRRCMIKYGGDLLIITQDGVVPMASALQSSRLDPRVSLTDKIQFAVSAAITTYGSNFGWQLCNFQKQNQLYINVPVQEGLSQQQFVMNTITKAWCNFTGWAANVFEIYADNLYFGGSGFIARAWNTQADNTANIQTFGLQSFQSYRSAIEKRCSMLRPHFLTNGNPTVYGNVNVDYDLSDTSAQLSYTPITAGVWDSSTWDSGVWGSDMVTLTGWQTATGIGYTFAPVIKTGSQGIRLEWVSTDLVFEGGGIL